MDFSSKPFLLDGATGTNLYRAGMPEGVCVEKWALEHPDAILSLQSAYADAGSDAVLAPTFSANRARLSHYGLGSRVAQMNKELLALSRRAVGGRAYVGADLSPTGGFPRPFGDMTFDELIDIYSEQGKALMEAGADFYMVETQVSLAEARAAVIALKRLGAGPVFVTMTVDRQGKTMNGNSALACLIVLTGLGADAFGLNCSTGPSDMLATLRELAPYAEVPLIAKPNAGVEEGEDGYRYLSPEDFAAYSADFLSSGVTILGGCCGTGPEHIKALREAVDKCPPQTGAPVKRDDVCIMAASEKEAFIFRDEPELSRPLACTENLAEDIMEAEEDAADILLVELNAPEDIETVVENSYMLKLPLCAASHDLALLEAMAVQHHGTLLIDSRSLSDRSAAKALSERYGCIIL